MASALDPGLSSLGLSPGCGFCVVFLGKTLYSHRASLHPSAQMGTRNLILRATLYQHPIQEWEVTLCDRNWGKLWPDGPFGWFTYLTLLTS